MGFDSLQAVTSKVQRFKGVYWLKQPYDREPEAIKRQKPVHTYADFLLGHTLTDEMEMLECNLQKGENT